MKVFAFDRDRTVSVNPPINERGVPLEWITFLAHETEHEVWAIGNQRLTREANIPGVEEALERHPDRSDSAASPVTYRREERVRMVGDLFPESEENVVIDDVNLDHLEGWTHYYPWEFVDAVEQDDFDLSVPDDDGGEPGRSAVDVLASFRAWLLGSDR